MGFSLNGIRSEDLGIIFLRNSQRPILPQTNDRTLSIPGRNGAWDFGADLDTRSFTLECALIEDSAEALQTAVERIAAALVDVKGKPKPLELVFDTRPDRYFTVRYVGSLDIERLIRAGQFTLPLIAFDPFSYRIEPILDSDIPLDSDVRLDGENYAFNITESTTIQLDNVGTLSISPVITITGSFDTLNLACGDKLFTYTEAVDGVLVIDGVRLTVQVDGVNKLSKITGDFIDISPGANQIEVSGVNLNFQISFYIPAKFL
ncbi:Phage tail protein [compost metagenome]